MVDGALGFFWRDHSDVDRNAEVDPNFTNSVAEVLEYIIEILTASSE